ncbi:MAG: hypothetical protein ACRBN8_33675 [Nannocystales bacterium]
MVDGVEREGGASAPDGQVPIILVCSTDDVELADTAAAGLRSRGFDVAVMGAAEDGSARLAEVVQRFERQGLYVLCRGGQLDRDGIDRLRGMLRSEDVPFGRTLTLGTGQGGARGLEERVVSVARRMVTGRFERTNAELADDESLADAGPPGDADAGVGAGEVDRWADSLADGDAPDADLDFGEELPTQVAETPLLGSEPGFDPGPETDPSLTPGHGGDYERVDTTLVTRHPITFPAASEESSAPTPAAAAHTPVSTPTPEDDDIDASEFSSGPNPRLVVGGGLALVLIIALVIAFSGSDDPAPSPANATADADAEVVAVHEDDSAGEATPQDAAASDVRAPSEPEPAKPAEPEPEPASESESESEPEPAEGTRRPLAHRSKVDPALLGDAVLSPTAPEERAAIAQALEEREVRSWNAFLIAGDDAPSMTFSDAETFCKTLSAGGISGWRLPSVGELLSITGAKLLDRKGVFWSETPGDAYGDTRLVVNAKKGSTSAVTVGWDGARPVCVRVRE